MGCHTWAYKRIESPSFEEMKEFVLKVYKDSIEGLQKWIDNPQDEEYLDMFKSYRDWTIEFIKYWQEAEKRRVRLIEGGFCKQAVINKYCEYSDGIVDHYNGNFYKEIGFHDMFRKYGYPQDKLFSLEETLAYINNPENECVINDNTFKWLEEFWAKYPDGMIDFG